MMTSAQSASRWAALTLATGLLLALPAAPAFAATSTVTTIGQLQTALADCSTAPNTITLGADIAAPTAELVVPCRTTLNLGTFDLAVRNILINAGNEFTVTGPTDGTEGTLTVDTRGVGTIAGIRTTGATFTVTGGIVDAYAGFHGAAIGGAIQQSGGTLNVAGGTVNASAQNYAAAVGGGYVGGGGGAVTVSGGALNATAAGPYGTAIGGGGAGAAGNGGAGATVTVTGGVVTVVATASYATGIGGGVAGLDDADLGGAGGSLTIGAGGEVVISSPNAFGSGRKVLTQLYGEFGSLQVDGILRLPSGNLRVGLDQVANPEVTVGSTGRILGGVTNVTIGATISGPGVIDNQGTISLEVPASTTGNNKLITFNPAGTTVRIGAPSFAAAGKTLPVPPVGTSWNTAANGSGAWFTTESSTAGSGTLNLFAAAPGTIEVSTVAGDLIATAGEAFDFPVTVNSPGGTPLSPQPTISYTSTDCTIGAGGVFTVPGSCSITASATVQGVALQETFTIQVVAGPVDSLEITPVSGTVTEGASIAFIVTGADEFGNAVNTDAAVLTTSRAADTVTDRSITFSGEGSHVVTATLGSVTAIAGITVVAGPLSSLSIAPTSHTATEGDTVTFTVIGTDSGGNAVDTSAAVLSSTGASDTVSGHSVTFSGAGPRFVSATLAGVTTTASVYVIAGPMASLSITPSTATVVEGESIGFTVSGADAAGNPVDVYDSVLTSSAEGDLVFWHAVRFSGAGSRTVTAEYLGFTATATVDVVAGPATSITLTPSTATVVEGDTIEFVISGADAAGNPVAVDDAFLHSMADTDTVNGRSIRFSGAGPRIIYAFLPGVTMTMASVDVVAGPLASLTLIPSPSSVVQGDTIEYLVTGEDAAGNPIDTEAAVLTSSAATDTVSGRSVTFSGAGSRVVAASLAGIVATADVEVVAGPVTSLTLEPSSTTAPQGGVVKFTVTAKDAAGNLADTTGVVLTSSIASDIVDGLSVAFPTASPHVITATLNGVSASVTIEVTPRVVPTPTPVVPTPEASPPAVLSSTGVDGTLAGGIALVLLLAGGTLLLARRSERQ